QRRHAGAAPRAALGRRHGRSLTSMSRLRRCRPFRGMNRSLSLMLFASIAVLATACDDAELNPIGGGDTGGASNDASSTGGNDATGGRTAATGGSTSSPGTGGRGSGGKSGTGGVTSSGGVT